MVNIIKTFRPVYCLLHKPSQVVRVWFLLISSFFYLTAAINTAGAATYYVDAVNGSDSNPGSIDQPWRTISKATSTLSPGDTALVRAGTYRESVLMQVSGTATNHITIKNYPEEMPIISGSEVLTGWTKCESQEACGGNPNWQNIYYTYAPAETSTFTANLYQNEDLLSISKYPDYIDPYEQTNRLGDYLLITKENIANTYIIDSILDEIGGESLIGSYVAVWVKGNKVVFKKITDYVSAETKIVFEDVGGDGVYDDRDSYYSIFNNLNGFILNGQGEYYINETPEGNGTHKVYLWPLNNQDIANEGEVTVSTRSNLFNFNDNDYITLEGFVFKRGLHRVIRRGWDKAERKGLIIRNNEFTQGSTGTDYANSIYIWDCNDLLFENNVVHYLRGNLRGAVFSGTNVKIRNNTFEKVGGTVVYLGGVNNGQIVNNTLTDNHGTHSNGLTVYNGCSNILIAGNRVINSNASLTMQASSNIIIYNNLFHGADMCGYVVANWGGMSGALIALNNIILGSDNNVSLDMSPFPDQVVCKNNILDGGGGESEAITFTQACLGARRLFMAGIWQMVSLKKVIWMHCLQTRIITI